MPGPGAPGGRARRVTPIALGSTSTRAPRTGSWKYIQPAYLDLLAPCNQGCPVGIDIEGYLNLLREGQVEEACALLVRENPMPAVTGRVCHHPCETACNRRSFDAAVAIHAIERQLGAPVLDAAPPKVTAASRALVAGVGSGTAGLSCAYLSPPASDPGPARAAPTDVAGALRAGAAAAFVARPGMVLDPLAPEPDVVGRDLDVVAERIIAAEPRGGG